MPDMGLDPAILVIGSVLAFVLLPFFTAWSLALALRGIRKRLDRIAALLDAAALAREREDLSGGGPFRDPLKDDLR